MSDKRILEEMFMEAWSKHFGHDYKFNGAADGKAAMSLVELFSPEQVVEVAKKAWAMPDDFNCKQAITLRGLSSRFNEIRGAVSMLKPAAKNGGAPKPKQWVSYGDKMKDPRWQRKRCSILLRDDFKCVVTGRADLTLNVHHRIYVGEPWDCPDEMLETICEPVHEVITEALRLLPKEVAFSARDVFGACVKVHESEAPVGFPCDFSLWRELAKKYDLSDYYPDALNWSIADNGKGGMVRVKNGGEPWWSMLVRLHDDIFGDEIIRKRGDKL